MNQVIIIDSESSRREKLHRELVARGMNCLAFHTVPEDFYCDKASFYILHVSNKEMWELSEKVVNNKVKGLIFISGGSHSEEIDAYYIRFGGHLYGQTDMTQWDKKPIYVEYVSANNFMDLINAVIYCRDKGQQNHTAKPLKSTYLSPFEKRRRDLSHDKFKNAFCNPLSYEATNVSAEHRFEVFRCARQQREFWLSMKKVATNWSQLNTAIIQMIQDVDHQGVFSCPKTAYLALKSKTLASLDHISELMTQLSGPQHSTAVLADAQIESFWQAVDVVAQLFKALAITGHSDANVEYFDSMATKESLAIGGED